MKANPNNGGTWPIPEAPPAFKKPKDDKPHWGKQDWEHVVKKGASDFANDYVDAAVAKKAEPILINGELVDKKM